MKTIGSVYDPSKSTKDLIDYVFGKNDLAKIPEPTLLYYILRLVQAKNKMQINLVIAPFEQQKVIMKVMEKIDKAIEKLSDLTKDTQLFSEVKIPYKLMTHPYINLLKFYLSMGYDKARVVKAIANQLDVPDYLVEAFFTTNDIDLSKITIEDLSEAFDKGVQFAKDDYEVSNLKELKLFAEKEGYKSDEVIHFIKGFNSVRKNKELSNDVGEEFKMLVDQYTSAIGSDKDELADELGKYTELVQY